jgi:hypothetical protein
LGISDPYYFAWVCEAIEAFDAESRRLSAARVASEGAELYLLTVLEPVGK